MSEEMDKVIASSELDEARKIAQLAHKGQTRRQSGEPYVTHCANVVEKVKELSDEIDLQIVAWLHDVLEDNEDWDYARLVDSGISQDNVEAVWTLTRSEGESYYDYIMRVNEDETGVPAYVKIADLQDNLSDLPQCALKDKYLLALEVLWMTWIDGAGTIDVELEEDVKEEIRKEMKEANSEAKIHSNKA